MNNRVPSGWKRARLINLVTLQRGFDLPITKREDGDVPIYAANGTVGYHNVSKIKGPGVITGRSGTIGKVHYSESDYWPLNTALFAKDFHGNDPKYVFWFLQWLHLERYHEGTGVPTLNRNNVHDLSVVIPPLEEQKRIATILDKADGIRRKRQQAMTMADEFLHSVFLDMFGDPVKNPKGWEVKPFGSLCINRDSKRIPLKQSGRAKMQGAYPYYGASGIIDWVDKPIFKGKYLLVGEDGANLLARTTPIAFLAEGEFWVNNHAHVVSEKSNARLEYLMFHLNCIKIDKYVTGSAQPKLNRKNMDRIPIPVPPVSLQNQFVEILEAKGAFSAKLQRLERTPLFESLSGRAFLGEL